MRWGAEGPPTTDYGAKGAVIGALLGDVGRKTFELRLDDLVALTAPRLQVRAIEHGDCASAAAN